MNKDSTSGKLLVILISGTGNIKLGNWQGTLIYFSTILLVGVGLWFLEQRLLEPYFNPSQTMRTFAVLIYIAFAFFWNGTRLLDSEHKKWIFNQDDNNPINGDSQQSHK
jgi:uncharacterized membrane protein SirB2